MPSKKDFSRSSYWANPDTMITAKELVEEKLNYTRSYSGELEDMKEKTNATAERFALLIDILYNNDKLSKEEVERIAKGY